MTSYNGFHCALRRVDWQERNISSHSESQHVDRLESVHPLTYTWNQSVHSHTFRSGILIYLIMGIIAGLYNWVIIVCSFKSLKTLMLPRASAPKRREWISQGVEAHEFLDKVDEDSQVSSVLLGCSFISCTLTVSQGNQSLQSVASHYVKEGAVTIATVAN